MLEKRLYTIILWCTLVLSVICIVTNFIGNYPWSTSVKWILLAIVAAVCIIIAKGKNDIENAKLIYFYFIIVIFLPFAFFDSGGSANNSIGYIYIVLIASVFLFDGMKRRVLVIVQLLVVTIIHVLEYNFPQWVKVYETESYYIERLLQIPIIMLAIYLIVVQFANAYTKQKHEQEMMNMKLEELANYDSLTNLYNRRAFDQELKDLQSSLNIENIFVAIIDIDNFKHINDQFGHLTGDGVLKEFAGELNALTSLPSISCRWGGDEFSILFHGTEEELNHVIEELQIRYKRITENLKIKTGLSVGVALWKKGVEAEEIMRKADMKLYEMKVKVNSK